MTEHIEKIRVLVESFDEETKNVMDRLMTIKHLKKGELLLQENEVCRKSYFMVNGIARKFFILDNKEVTTEFFFEEDIAVSFESLVNQKPSKEVIECLTDVTVEAVDYNAFYQIRGQYPQLMEYVILVTELYVIWLEDRIFDFHARSATDRYLNLLKKYPEYIHHIKLTHISSYLGISLETLSRIRAKI
ncbi:Crp/Fnr family transcriptional regulator [Elizabethkingia anophelis]|nr:Crp/Fnr family transcriptional regulator [Elizabethkingia anophelis]MCT3959230.1 Crp/Fnr family transcriptional regulator [Elizabethkingia anophelis]MCT4063279.1 Crp/Fnr family transcriptional regulator [Elizabethkingia anophelis]MCT4109571.1 Crp/Fnr family transcriptional regulator [Elizabethkingia anophelis]